MRLTVRIHDFNDYFMDIIPFSSSLDNARIVQCLIDDLNGLLNLSQAVAREEPIDFRKISNTLEYLTKDAEGIISEAGMVDMKAAVGNLMDVFFDELRGYPRWTNMRFRYVRHQEASSGSWTIRMDATDQYNYDDRICELMMEMAQRLLEQFCAKDDRRY